MPHKETRELVLDVAREFVQTRGYNAFSFRDVAERVAIKTASVHYYFPTKGELCRALIERQRAEVRSALGLIDEEVVDAVEKLARYLSVFRRTLETGHRMCLCGMLAADVATLDPSIVEALRLSFEEHEAWLERVLSDGMESGVLRYASRPGDEARMLLASLEGAMLVSRTFEDLGRFDVAARGLVEKLRA